MQTNEALDPETSQRRCPVCWSWFTPNSLSNPYPRRYCCGACRIEASRRRRHKLTLDAQLDVLEPPATPKGPNI